MGTCQVGWAHSRFGQVATGVSMHVLAAMQLMGEAGEMQLPGERLAGVFNMGGSAVASNVGILERPR